MSNATTFGSMLPQAGHAPLVLASASPRRRTLLAEIGVRFESITVAVDERPLPNERAEPYARRVAREKAHAAVAVRPNTWILAADTVVSIDGLILGKPADSTAARAMLARLSGRTHRVLTAVVLLAPDRTVDVDEAVVSRVRFRQLPAREIDQYIATGEPFDKAGGYGVQALGGRLVEDVDGSFSSVVGLPIELVKEILGARGLLDEE